MLYPNRIKQIIVYSCYNLYVTIISFVYDLTKLYKLYCRITFVKNTIYGLLGGNSVKWFGLRNIVFIILYITKTGTSETIRKEMKYGKSTLYKYTNHERLKKVSSYKPKHIKPLTDSDFGHYIAGLIDGDGNFSKGNFNIAFAESDIKLANYIKSRLKFGTVKKVKNKKAILFILTKKEGIQKVVNLVNGKLRVPFKMECIKKYLINHYKKEPFHIVYPLSLNKDNDLNNHWFAGFADADASFQIKILNRKTNTSIRTEIRLNFQVDQKTSHLLKCIQNAFGGYIGYRATNDTYYYGSTSFGSARKLIQYFDRYHLLSSKYINYILWRKAYLLVQEGKHLTSDGVFKIKKWKSYINRNNLVNNANIDNE